MPSASLIKEFEQLVGKENVFTSEADTGPHHGYP